MQWTENIIYDILYYQNDFLFGWVLFYFTSNQYFVFFNFFFLGGGAPGLWSSADPEDQFVAAWRQQ